MTDTPKETPRVLTEGEAYAIAAAEVKRETAERDTTIEQLKSEKAELANEVDLKVAAYEAEKARADAAEQALADYKAQVENEKAAAARTEARVGKVREVAKHLKEEFFTPERAARWASMDDEAFDVYVRELAEVCTVAASSTPGEPPRETAMAGSAIASEQNRSGNLKKLWGVN